MNAVMRLNLERIERDYDPENDIGSPEVTWTDYQLLDVIKMLIDQNEKLEARIEKLEQQLNQQSEIDESVKIWGTGL